MVDIAKSAYLSVFTVVIVAILTVSPQTASADDANDCIKGRGEIRLNSCSRIIETKMLFGNPISPEHLATAFMSRGNSYLEMERYDQAINDYNQAIILVPDNANFYSNRANAYEQKNQSNRAISDYNTAIHLNPKFAIAYNNRGTVFKNQEKFESAIADFNKSISLNPGYPYVYLNRGTTYEQIGEFDKAESDFRMAIRLNPNDEFLVKEVYESLKRIGKEP